MSLAASLIRGNRVCMFLGEQIVAFNTIVDAVARSSSDCVLQTAQPELA